MFTEGEGNEDGFASIKDANGMRTFGDRCWKSIRMYERVNFRYL